jgi:hypothetical protein
MAARMIAGSFSSRQVKLAHVEPNLMFQASRIAHERLPHRYKGLP